MKKIDREEILKKAIEQAKTNGFKYRWEYEGGDNYMPWDWWFDRERYRQIIFDPSFAEAFWGNPRIEQPTHLQGGWQHHLQQMVISEDPIKYLEQFI